ncbi:diaminopropionate ammonia-lyase [Streptomyces sp. NPDC087659]|uniref:diaminopropionate ammonia-lyase n=1 Tax=Streptomyces sp. NPDC087659 TaxID=3365801 RepID=UPI0037FE7BB8
MTETTTCSTAWYARPAARAWRCAPAPAGVAAFHAGLPGYRPTPLREIPCLADELGVGRVFVKDESDRFGLAAFKALGVSWAVHLLLSRHRNGDADRPRSHHEPPYADREPPRTGAPLWLVTATDGNHGRAVARTPRQCGVRARVFVAEGVHPRAVAAIEAEGAEVVRVAGSYDTAVSLAEKAAGEPDSALVQDMAWPGYEEVPGWIVDGCSTLFAETDTQVREAGSGPAGLVVVPTGVGSLAQAAVTHYRSRPSGPVPAMLTVEADGAACVLASLAAGRPVTVETGRTALAGLNCGTVSSLAWPVLRDGLDAAVAVGDADAARAARDLAAHGVSAGPCGAASLAGARAALGGVGAPDRRAALGVGPGTAVVLLCTEGTAANPHGVPGPAPAPV